MEVIGFALLGVVIGAVGTEILRSERPEIIEKIEEVAKRFVDSVCSSKSDEEQMKDK